MTLRRAYVAIALCLLAVGAVVALLALPSAPSPFYLVQPGPTLVLGPQITVPADYARDAGWLALTSIRNRRATFGDLLTAPFDPAIAIVSESDLYPPGVSGEERALTGRRQIESSKRAAAVVALRRAGYAVQVVERGLLVERIFPGDPADGTLRTGDVVLKANGTPTGSSADLAAVLRSAGIGAPIDLEVLRLNRRERLTVTTAPAPDGPARPILGVRISPHVASVDLPFRIEVDTRQYLGPSGGLMMALALFDALTGGDLAGGHHVSGTGTIEPGGAVGPIGGVDEKVTAAEREGADVFLVPRQNAAQAARAAHQIRLIPVGSFDEALAALGDLGGRAELAQH